MNNDFGQRFNITTPLPEARARFVNRVSNLIFGEFLSDLHEDDRYHAVRWVATELGHRYEAHDAIEAYTKADFLETLRAIEALRNFWTEPTDERRRIDKAVEYALLRAEADLEVRWHEGNFLPAGAGELDEALVNDVLQWLGQDSRLSNVRESFELALHHFAASTAKPELRKAVITEAYEALESLSKIVTEKNNKDLSGNRERFLSAIGAPEEVKPLVREYIGYGCDYRHGPGLADRPVPGEADTEMFLYLTGALIRRAVRGGIGMIGTQK